MKIRCPHCDSFDLETKDTFEQGYEETLLATRECRKCKLRFRPIEPVPEQFNAIRMKEKIA